MIKNLTLIILTDRDDNIFHQSLMSAALAEKLIILDQETKNDWPQLKKELKKLNPKIEITIVERQGKIEDFARVRNNAIKMVKTDWLMFLDSDEVFQVPDPKYLKQLLNSHSVSGYQVKRSDYFLGNRIRFGEAGTSQPIRLAYKNKIVFERKVHETAKITGIVADSGLEIKHLAHKNLQEFLADISDYALLEAQYRYEQQLVYSALKIICQALTYPVGKFLYNYVWKLGFLDGFGGFIYASFMSLHSLLVRVYLYEQYFLN